ncbi:hypothetical protein ACQY0O_003267 [Thecaphora frezii]
MPQGYSDDDAPASPPRPPSPADRIEGGDNDEHDDAPADAPSFLWPPEQLAQIPSPHQPPASLEDEPPIAYDPSDFDTHARLPDSSSAPPGELALEPSQQEQQQVQQGQRSQRARQQQIASTLEPNAGHQGDEQQLPVHDSEELFPTEVDSVPLQTVPEGRRVSGFEAATQDDNQPQQRQQQQQQQPEQPQRPQQQRQQQQERQRSWQSRQTTPPQPPPRTQSQARAPGTLTTRPSTRSSRRSGSTAVSTPRFQAQPEVFARKSSVKGQQNERSQLYGSGIVPVVPPTTPQSLGEASSSYYAWYPTHDPASHATFVGPSAACIPVQRRSPPEPQATHGSKYVAVTTPEPVGDRPVGNLGGPLPRVKRAPPSRTQSQEARANSAATESPLPQSGDKAMRPHRWFGSGKSKDAIRPASRRRSSRAEAGVQQGGATQETTDAQAQEPPYSSSPLPLASLDSAARLSQDVRKAWDDANRDVEAHRVGLAPMAEDAEADAPHARATDDRDRRPSRSARPHHQPQRYQPGPRRESLPAVLVDDEEAGRRLRVARRKLLQEADDIRARDTAEGNHGDPYAIDEALQQEEEGLPVPIRPASQADVDDNDRRGSHYSASSMPPSHPHPQHPSQQPQHPQQPHQHLPYLPHLPHHHQQPRTDRQSRGETDSVVEEDKSSMSQTRHPGLAGARPVPRGRTAGGPAVSVGTRHNSYSSTQTTHQEPQQVPPLHRSGSSRMSARTRRSSQPVSLRRRQPASLLPQRQDSTATNTTAPAHDRKPSIRSTVSVAPNKDDGHIGLIEPRPSVASAKHGDRYRDDHDHDGRDGSYHNRYQHDMRQPWLPNDGHLVSTWSDATATATNSLYENDGGAGGNVPQRTGSETYSTVNNLQHVLFPNLWSRWRFYLREFLAELMASMLLLVIGTSVDCQVALSKGFKSSGGGYPNQNWAWGLAVMATIYLSGGRSGAHVNPAITLALAVFRGFPWKQVPVYWSAQLLGAFLGSAVTYSLYLPAINDYEGGSHVRTLSGDHATGKLFVTVPQLVTTAASGFGFELVATAIVTVMVLAVGDETNAPPGDGMTALVLGLTIAMVGMSLGWASGQALSPSRDLGPRLWLTCMGYGKELWTHDSSWWIYGPQAGCFSGALLGGLIYDLTIFTGAESPVNYTSEAWRESTPSRLVAPVSKVVRQTRREKEWGRDAPDRKGWRYGDGDDVAAGTGGMREKGGREQRGRPMGVLRRWLSKRSQRAAREEAERIAAKVREAGDGGTLSTSSSAASSLAGMAQGPGDYGVERRMLPGSLQTREGGHGGGGRRGRRRSQRDSLALEMQERGGADV